MFESLLEQMSRNTLRITYKNTPTPTPTAQTDMGYNDLLTTLFSSLDKDQISFKNKFSIGFIFCF